MKQVRYARVVDDLVYNSQKYSLVKWNNTNNMLSTNNGYSSCKLNKGECATSLYFKNFNFNLGSEYSIKSLTVTYSICKSGNCSLKTPVAYFCPDKDDIGMRTSGMDLRTDLTKYKADQVLGDNYLEVSFSADVSQITNIASEGLGVALIFNANEGNPGEYRIDYVKIEVEYNAPSYQLFPTVPLRASKNDSLSFDKVPLGGAYLSVQVSNSSGYEMGEQTISLDMPVDVQIIKGWATTLNQHSTAYYNEEEEEFIVNISDTGVVTLYLEVKLWSLGVQTITFKNQYLGDYNTYLNVTEGSDYKEFDLWRIKGELTESHQHEYVNVHYVGEVLFNTDGTHEFNITHEGNIDNQTIVLNKTLSSAGITQISKTTDSYLGITAPKGKKLDLVFDVQFIQHHKGANKIILDYKLEADTYSISYTTHDPYQYVFTTQSKNCIKVLDYRSSSVTSTGAYIYPCAFDEYDDPWIVKECSLRARLFTGFDFIGPVKLEYSHYDPTNTTKDTLLNTSYKSKRYMGKEGVYDETISLNIKLPPTDIVTIQGLVKMDSPVPLDCCHTCFELDPLNHRGWAELYAVSNIKRTNSWYYDCDISVKYLTHNLNTRFLINKGSLISPYFLPSNYKESFAIGDDLSEYFTFIPQNGHYLDIVNPYRRNLFVLGNNESAKIRSKEPLNKKSKFMFNWDSSRLTVNDYNNMSRVFRLLDSNNNAVFEYEWYDFSFDYSGYYPCRVIARVLTNNGYEVVLNRSIKCHSDVEISPEDIQEIEGTTEPYGVVDVYGSKLNLELENNILNLVDEGYTGKETFLKDIELTGTEYRVEVEFKNLNTSFTDDILNYFTFQITELEATVDETDNYKDIIVSPFPVVDKELRYIRDTADGLMYYFYNDEYTASYIMSPYFLYQGGVDLTTKDGVSLVDLDNSYQVFYITNGLIKVGFNRYNGRVVIFKYNNKISDYEYIDTLQLTKYDDYSISVHEEDKIELQVSDTIFRVWRGRPFIQIKHPNETLIFKSDYKSVYCEGLNDTIYGTPEVVSLDDKTNLLPVCIGSTRKIKSDCIEVVGDTINYNYTDISITVDGVTEGITADVNDTITVTYTCNDMMSEEGYIILNGIIGESVSLKEYTGTFEVTLNEVGDNTLRLFCAGIKQGGMSGHYGLSNILKIKVTNNGYVLTPKTSDTVYYKDRVYNSTTGGYTYYNSFKALLTNAGVKSSGNKVLMNIHGVSYETTTNSEGIAEKTNDLNTGDYPVVYTYNYPSPSIRKTQATETVTIEPLPIKTKYVSRKELTTPDTSEYKDYTSVLVVKGECIFVKFFNKNREEDLKSHNDGYSIFKGQTVILEVNGVPYTRITDPNGAKVKLKINLEVGTYDLKIIYPGDSNFDSVENHIELVVKENEPIIPKYCVDTENATPAIEDYTTDAPLEVTQGEYIFVRFFDDMYKKPLSEKLTDTFQGKKVILNINDVDYNRTTDSVGKVKLKITLDSGEYTLKVTYAGDDHYGSVDTSIKVVVNTNE